MQERAAVYWCPAPLPEHEQGELAGKVAEGAEPGVAIPTTAESSGYLMGMADPTALELVVAKPAAAGGDNLVPEAPVEEDEVVSHRVVVPMQYRGRGGATARGGAPVGGVALAAATLRAEATVRKRKETERSGSLAEVAIEEEGRPEPVVISGADLSEHPTRQ